MAKVFCRHLLPDSVMLAAFVWMIFGFGRAVLPAGDPPAFLLERSGGIRVELGQGFRVSGACQIFGEMAPASIIYLTEGRVVAPHLLQNPDWTKPLENGERLDIQLDGEKINAFHRSWMSAWARITLSVPLDPDRMTQEDWSALPGIGKKLAARIEIDRQKNGEFGDLRALQRVPGIGPKRLIAWQEYF